MTNTTNCTIIPVQVMNTPPGVSETSFLVFSAIAIAINTAIFTTQLWSILRRKGTQVIGALLVYLDVMNRLR
ncbi:hypothetical protein F5Y05DRAFT_377531 [Hypoxylon sp. FL0543]|nr:hypothetical protein F5Y05DRAFT_377531 [Hypoxylon sp. FL0543]